MKFKHYLLLLTVVVLPISIFGGCGLEEQILTTTPPKDLMTETSTAAATTTTSEEDIVVGVVDETPTPADVLTTPLTTTLFLLSRIPPNYSGIQIWKLELPQRRSSLLYEDLHPDEEFKGYLADVIPSNELDIYSTLHGDYPKGEVDIVHFLDELNVTVSPRGKKIAWVEGIGWYPDVFDYGYSQVVVLDAETKKKNDIVDYNFHLPLREDTSIVMRPGSIRIISLTWSPKAQFLAITTDFHKGAYAQLGVYDLESQTLTEQEIGSLSGVPVWANNDSLLAYSFVSDNPNDVKQRSGIKVVRIQSNSQLDEIATINTGEPFFVSSDLQWAPDDKQIVAVMSPGDRATGANELSIANIDTGMVQEVMLEGFPSGLFSDPKWSPSGRYIGVNYRSDPNEFVEQLVVLEPKSGQILANLPLERPETGWGWTSDENLIVVEGRAPTTPMQVSLWRWQSGGTELQSIFPNEDVKNISDGAAYLSIVK